MADNHQCPLDGFFPTRRSPQCPPEFFEAPPRGNCNYNNTWFSMMRRRSRRHEETEAHEQHMQKRARLSNDSSLSNQLQKIFFKTRPCRMFEDGNCPHGWNCTFAHGPGDIRQPPPNWQEIAAKEQLGYLADQSQQGHKPKICKRYYNGDMCMYGDRCTFLHVTPNALRNESQDRIDGSRIDSFCGDGNWSDQRSAFWKTRPCHKYEKHGHCPNGHKCQYAHGVTELMKHGGNAELMKHGGNADAGKTNPAVARSGPPAEQAWDDPQAQTTREQEAHQDKKLSKWKWPKKISRIYGDWIDD